MGTPVSPSVPPTLTYSQQTTPANLPLTRCATPITLRIGTVDPEFQVAPASLEDALRKAASEWNSATGQERFIVSTSDGVAVNFLFDGRQAELDQLKATEHQLDEEIARLSKERSDRERESRDIERLMGIFKEEQTHYEQLVAAHNAGVSRAQEGGAPDSETLAIVREQERRLNELRAGLEASNQRIKQKVDEYNQRALITQQEGESLREKIALLKEQFPPRLIREAEHRKGAFVNEINVYTLSDARDLHYTLLHELGHTLGLGHANGTGAVMSPIRELGSLIYHLTPSDIDAAHKLCEDEE